MEGAPWAMLRRGAFALALLLGLIGIDGAAAVAAQNETVVVDEVEDEVETNPVTTQIDDEDEDDGFDDWGLLGLLGLAGLLGLTRRPARDVVVDPTPTRTATVDPTIDRRT